MCSGILVLYQRIFSTELRGISTKCDTLCRIRNMWKCPLNRIFLYLFRKSRRILRFLWYIFVFLLIIRIHMIIHKIHWFSNLTVFREIGYWRWRWGGTFDSLLFSNFFASVVYLKSTCWFSIVTTFHVRLFTKC